jgi:hypothetical protein
MPDLVKVLSASSIMEGEIVKARLEGEGIPVLLKGGGSDPYGMGVAYVFVPSEFEAQARLVLEDVSDETSGRTPRGRPRDDRVSAWSTAGPCGPS